MEGLHTVGDIITKISVNCVINLHVALLFMCLFLWVYPMCGYNCLYIYGYCLYMLHVYVYYYFSMNPVHLQNVFVCLRFIYKFSTRVLCVYVLIACSSKTFMWHSLVGCWVCYSMFHREKKHIFSCSIARYGWSGMLQRIFCMGFMT
jgi:hypothetical protein